MKKSDIFNAVLDKVSEICEVRKELILDPAKRMQTIVDARCIAIQFLRRAGLNNYEIAMCALKGDSDKWPSDEDVKKRSRCYDSIFRHYVYRFEQSFAFRAASRDMDVFVRENFNN